MSKKLPSIYANRIVKPLTNNRTTFYSEKEAKTDFIKTESISNQPINDIEASGTTVEDQLLKIFRNKQHVFNIPVVIETSDKKYDTKVAGRIQNRIITMDNDSIPVEEIKNIIIKDRD